MSDKLVIPGVKYGVFQELLPSCRSVDGLFSWMVLYGYGEVEIKLHKDITEQDCCQRGPDGLPLLRVTPFVPFKTLEEWRNLPSDAEPV